MNRTAEYAKELLLLHEMERISENYWCAGWLSGLEFTLWSGILGADSVCSLDELDRLKQLSDDAGGWWRWNDELQGEEFIDLERWQVIYNEGRANGELK